MQCCCGVTEPDIDGDVPCITVTFSGINATSCTLDLGDGSTNSACDDAPHDYYKWIAGSVSGINQTFRLPVVSANTPTHPFGVYTYQIVAPVVVAYRAVTRSYFPDLINPDPVEYVCADTYRQDIYSYESATITVEVNYVDGVDPEVTEISIDLDGTYILNTTTNHPIDGSSTSETVNTSWSYTGASSQGLFSTSNLSADLGESVANNNTIIAGCTSSQRSIFAGGSAVVNPSPSNICFDFPTTYKAVACGTPPSGVDPEIFVDIDDKPTGADTQDRFPFHQSWPYNLTDERFEKVLPSSGVTWGAAGCYPAAKACAFEFYAPFDEGLKPLDAITAFTAGLQFDLSTIIYQPGPVQDLTYSTDPCPGSPAPLMARGSTATDSVNSAAPDPTKKSGMVSEAELEVLGADVETEKRRASQGGCCGVPTQTD